jgi:pimeloyl-ACP methyl ester carboxylesterase
MPNDSQYRRLITWSPTTGAASAGRAKPWGGYDYDTFADDLATIFDVLDLKDAAQFGFSMGGVEVARYVGRHGTKRLSKTGLGGGGAPTDAEDVLAVRPGRRSTVSGPG